MASVTLRVGGRRYELACREGQQPAFERLAAMVDTRVADAARVLGTTNEARQLLLAALLLADELGEAQRAAPEPAEPTDGLADALGVLAGRLERLADALEIVEPGA